MTRISGPRQVRIKPLVPPVNPTLQRRQAPYAAAAAASYPGARSVFRLAAPIPAPADRRPQAQEEGSSMPNPTKQAKSAGGPAPRGRELCGAERRPREVLRAGWVTGIGRQTPTFTKPR